MVKFITCDNRTFSLLKDVILDFWENELPPEQWETGLLKILPKKGDLSKPTNYRGIMLLETVYKIVAKIVHTRLQPFVESLDHENHTVFHGQAIKRKVGVEFERFLRLLCKLPRVV